MFDEKCNHIQMVENWLNSNDILFKKSVHDDNECVFMIYQDAINQAALLLEVCIGNLSDAVSIRCNLAPHFPQMKTEKIAFGLESLSYIHHPVCFSVVDDTVVAETKFKADLNAQEYIADVVVEINLFKEAVDGVIPYINFMVWNTN